MKLFTVVAARPQFIKAPAPRAAARRFMNRRARICAACAL